MVSSGCGRVCVRAGVCGRVCVCGRQVAAPTGCAELRKRFARRPAMPPRLRRPPKGGILTMADSLLLSRRAGGASRPTVKTALAYGRFHVRQ